MDCVCAAPLQAVMAQRVKDKAKRDAEVAAERARLAVKDLHRLRLRLRLRVLRVRVKLRLRVG